MASIGERYNIVVVIVSLFHYWDKIEELNEWNKGNKNRQDDDDDDQQEQTVDKLVIYRQILDILQPGETVLKVIIQHW